MVKILDVLDLILMYISRTKIKVSRNIRVRCYLQFLRSIFFN